MKKRGESYYGLDDAPSVPHCVIDGCGRSITHELHAGDGYSDGLKLFRGISRPKLRTRRLGDPRFFICALHLETGDLRLRALRWQQLLFIEKGASA
jgi:hypothetical protein